MLKNIKSEFFIKRLFSFLINTRRFDIIKYNKQFQTQLGLDIKHYKILSKVYIIYESKNFGKEYLGTDGTLLNEGEYLNGKRNGKGIEYDGEFRYEGEFKNGKKNGLGKIYKMKHLVFEGEFKDGKKNGYGKTYELDKISEEGEFLDNELYKGKTYDHQGNVKYEIDENGIRLISSYGDLSQCEYLDCKKNGRGKRFNSDGKLIFEGEFLKGKKNGEGIEYFHENNLLYKGKYLNDQRHGKGKICTFDGKTMMEGEYLYGRQWNTKFYDKEGNIIFELKNGKGKSINAIIRGNNEQVEYQGEFVGGLPNGQGIEVKNGQIIFEGEYINGQRNGKGIEYDEDVEIKFEGEYL